jgi:hypothetical protein
MIFIYMPTNKSIDELGEDFANFNPSGDGLLRIVQNWGNEVSNRMRIDLRKNKTNASQTLSQSIASIAKPTPKGFNLKVEMQDYWYYVEYGRKPIGKDGKPSVKLQQSIAEWIVEKKIQTRTSSTQSRAETVKALAYVIARKIHRKGTKAQPFVAQNVNDKMLQILSDRMGDYIAQSLAGD